MTAMPFWMKLKGKNVATIIMTTTLAGLLDRRIMKMGTFVEEDLRRHPT
jgi:hypothetical protein